ncbi:MAG: sulfate adenylyltransferase subunit CysD [archaeon]
MDHLDKLESQSVYIIREAYKKFQKMSMLWSVGKDSTVLLWLAKKAFYGKVPFPVIHIDTGLKFKEMYEFRDMCVEKWGLKLIVADNSKEAEEKGIGPDQKIECCTMRKTEALKKCIAEHKFEALLLGIRRDEHGIRAKERVFSPRNKDFQWDYKNQPPEMWDQFKTQKEGEQHLRVHPLLHWTEIDVWKYVQRENLPINPLYFAKNGKRYRSLGCVPCTKPIDSTADTVDKIITEVLGSKIGERSGRSQDKETANAMQKLRSLGYM